MFFVGPQSRANRQTCDALGPSWSGDIAFSWAISEFSLIFVRNISSWKQNAAKATQNRPSLKETRLPTIHLQVLCWFQGGYFLQARRWLSGLRVQSLKNGWHVSFTVCPRSYQRKNWTSDLCYKSDRSETNKTSKKISKIGGTNTSRWLWSVCKNKTSCPKQ